MPINIDDELARLEAEEKKLTLIKEKRSAIATLKNELFPEIAPLRVDDSSNESPVVASSDPLKVSRKKDQIVEFAKNYLSTNGDVTTSQIVGAIDGAGQGWLLADRKNKVVAVSQALGKRRDLFATDRSRGWFLVETE